MAELADALDLGSSSSECRFDSCYPHSKSLITTDIVVVRFFLFWGGKRVFLII